MQYYHVDLASLKLMLHLIVDHAYVTVGDRVFRQSQGIPMGVNPAV